MASAAPSSDFELVKPAGLHFVEAPGDKVVLPGNSHQIHDFLRPHVFLIHIFPRPLANSCEAYESVVGHVSRICQKVNSRTGSHRGLDRIRVKIKWGIRKLSWKRRLRRKWRPGPFCVFQHRTMLTKLRRFVFKCADFFRVHGHFFQNQVRIFCPTKMQVYIYVYSYIYI